MISTSILLLIIWTCHTQKSSWSIKLRCCLGSKLHSLHIIYPEVETKKKTISGEAEAAGVPLKVPKLPPNVTHDPQCLMFSSDGNNPRNTVFSFSSSWVVSEWKCNFPFEFLCCSYLIHIFVFVAGFHSYEFEHLFSSYWIYSCFFSYH